MQKKVFISIFLSIILISACSNHVFADEKSAGEEKAKVDTSISIEDAIKGADNFVKKGKEQVDENELKGASTSLVNIFIVAGTVIAVVYIGILGIKYMFGAVEEKAEIKETLVPFIVGCVVVFGAFTIWKIIIVIGSYI